MGSIDLRIPIGILFVSLGVLLVIYGFFSNPALYQHSSGFNINLTWGVVMTIFGLAMLAGARLSYKKRD